MKTLSNSSCGATSRLISPFYPSLDGLRAIAFFMVFLVHYAPMLSNAPIWRWGWVGVDLFFVLSGFLITGILFDSLQRNDYFRTFYKRRSLRIFPLFYGFWIALLLCTPLLHFQWNRYILTLPLYIGNFFYAGGMLNQHAATSDIIFPSLIHHGQLMAINLSALWSLCVEEQFYLVWPLIIFLVRSRRALLGICVTTMAVVLLGRVLYVHLHTGDPGLIYFNTFARTDTLMMGAALALWLRGPVPSLAILRRAAWIILLAGPLLLFAVTSLDRQHVFLPNSDPFIATFGYTIIAITSAAALLLAIDNASPLARVLHLAPLRFLGRLSYGLYFFHLLPSALVITHIRTFQSHHMGFLTLLAPFCFALTAAWLSFRFLESPFLRLKSRLAPQKGHIADPIPVPPSSGRISTGLLPSPAV